MSNIVERKDFSVISPSEGHQEFVTVKIKGQRFGIPVLIINDVLNYHPITRVPLAPNEIRGILNLRGHIVTAIDLRRALNVEDSEENQDEMIIVIEENGQWFGFIVDEVGDVMSLPDEQFENNPGTMDDQWKRASSGVYRLENELLVVLNIEAILSTLKS